MPLVLLGDQPLTTDAWTDTQTSLLYYIDSISRHAKTRYDVKTRNHESLWVTHPQKNKKKTILNPRLSTRDLAHMTGCGFLASVCMHALTRLVSCLDPLPNRLAGLEA